MSHPPLQTQYGAPIRWYLSVLPGDGGLGSSGSLYWRDVKMAFLPSEGDRVHLLWDEKEQESGLGHEVKRRYWEHGGIAVLEVKAIRLDPDEQWQKNWTVRARYETAWYSDRDGDLLALLRASGWKEYGED